MHNIIDRRETNRDFDLASTLFGAWILADVELRADLENAIRGYASRNDSFRIALRQVVEFNIHMHNNQKANDPRYLQRELAQLLRDADL